MAPALPTPPRSSNIFASNPNSSRSSVSSSAPFLFSSSRYFDCAARRLRSVSSTVFSSPGKYSAQLQPLRVSIAQVEYVPPPPDFDYRKEIPKLKGLKSKLCNCSNLEDKLRTLDSDSRVRSFFNAGFGRLMGELNLDKHEFFLLKCLVAAGQEHVLGEFGHEFVSKRSSLKTALYALADMIEKWESNGGHCDRPPGRVGFGLGEEEVKALRLLLKSLDEIEQFYDSIGGIIGYQIKVLELLVQSTFERQTSGWSTHTCKPLKCESLEIHPPRALDLSQDVEYASQAALWGLEALPVLGEIYPLGGAGDRLGLVDPDTGECLPAAMLPFCGRTLLEGLIRDLQAREFLYYKVYGNQCIIPVAVMTSSAKNNHERILHLCESHSWFGRGRSNFILFEQLLVPKMGSG